MQRVRLTWAQYMSKMSRFDSLIRRAQKSLGVETSEALSGQLFPEAVQGRNGGLVDRLLGDAQPLANLGVAVSLSDEGEDLLSSCRQCGQQVFQHTSALLRADLAQHILKLIRQLLAGRGAARRGEGCEGEISFRQVLPGMTGLLLMQRVQRIPNGPRRIRFKRPACRIKRQRRPMQRRMRHGTHIIGGHARNVRVAARDLVGQRQRLVKQSIGIGHDPMFATG